MYLPPVNNLENTKQASLSLAACVGRFHVMLPILSCHCLGLGKAFFMEHSTLGADCVIIVHFLVFMVWDGL